MTYSQYGPIFWRQQMVAVNGKSWIIKEKKGTQRKEIRKVTTSSDILLYCLKIFFPYYSTCHICHFGVNYLQEKLRFCLLPCILFSSEVY